MSPPLQVSIFGLGYVGAVTAGCLAELGHHVIGADVQQQKVDACNAGLSPIVEPELSDLLRQARRAGRLRATTEAAEAVRASDVSFVCVGTPPLESGGVDLASVRKVSAQIRDALTASGKRHVLVFRSTVLPGSTRALVRDFFAELLGTGQLRVYYCPEFLREATAVRDFREPSLAVIGTHDGRAPESAEAARLLGGRPEILSWEGAELLKYSCNYFHALKVGFANEIGRLSKFVGEDGGRVMGLLCSDTTLNISAYYLRPGNPFGGSCLVKDVSALRFFAGQEGLSLPLLEHTLASNQAHLDQLIALIAGKERRRVGLLGLAFKAGTDDLRGSPMVAVAATLLARGYELQIYDPLVNPARLTGANAEEIQRRIPHLGSLLRAGPCDVIEQSEVIVVSQRCGALEELAAAARAEQWLIDLNGWRELESLPWRYEGACW